MRALIIAASLLGLLLVAAGAAGGHNSVPLEATSRWHSAFLYGFVHALAAAIANHGVVSRWEYNHTGNMHSSGNSANSNTASRRNHFACRRAITKAISRVM